MQSQQMINTKNRPLFDIAADANLQGWVCREEVTRFEDERDHRLPALEKYLVAEGVTIYEKCDMSINPDMWGFRVTSDFEIMIFSPRNTQEYHNTDGLFRADMDSTVLFSNLVLLTIMAKSHVNLKRITEQEPFVDHKENIAHFAHAYRELQAFGLPITELQFLETINISSFSIADKCFIKAYLHRALGFCASPYSV